jgi:CRP-like cAMP-binding protein
VTVLVLSDNPDRFASGSSVFLEDGTELTVRAVRGAGSRALIAFVGFITSQRAAARAAILALARQAQSQQSFVDDLLFLDLKGRVAKRLLQLVAPDLEHLPPDGAVVPEVTQADLASLCGGSRENVTRTLTEFQRRGLIQRDGHRYVLKKVGGLAKIADL